VRALAKGETGSMDQSLPLKKSVTFMIIGLLILIIYLYFFVGVFGIILKNSFIRGWVV